MKLSRIGQWAMLFPALAFGISAPALAHKVVHVQGTLYVIICEPGGQAFTFNGTSTGAGEIGGYLCSPPSTEVTGPGGISGGSSSSVVIEAVAAEPLLRQRGINPADLGRKKPSGTTQNCPKGTHWYEPAKACVANGGHPSL